MPGDDNSLFEAILPTFVEELHEHVDALNRNLLGLEGNIPSNERTQLLNELFRTTHTLKGASAMINIDLLEDTCHQFEEILTALRKGALDLAPGLLQLLFEMCDGIQDAGAKLSEQSTLVDSSLHGILPKLALVMMDVDWQRLDESEAGETDSARTETSAERAPQVPAAPAVDPLAAAPDEQTVDPFAASPAPPAAQADESDTGLIDPLAEILNPEPAPARDEEPEETTGRSTGTKTRFFKVTSDKIDQLVAKTGDLLSTRDRMETRAEEVQALQEEVARWRSEWLHMRKTVTAQANGARGESGPNKLEHIFDTFYLRLRDLGKKLDTLSAQLAGDRSNFRQSVIPMEEDVRSMRMVPFSEACHGFERMVRDVARMGNKEVRLVVEGRDVELDRTVLESIKDPLRHLVRNAVDHGIEAPATRIANGKEVTATVTVSAAIRGPLVEISVSDDGRGLSHDAIRAKAEASGMAVPADPMRLVSLIFEPGFSTAEKVTQISGRGVGLDVVKATIESLHGSINVGSEPGAGTRFSLTMPLTLTTIRVLLVKAAGQLFSTLATSVEQIVNVDRHEIRLIGGRPVISLNNELIPIASLAETLELENILEDERETLPAVVMSADNHRVAFSVDEFLAEQQVVVKSLGSRLGGVRNVSGASVLSGDEIVLILNTGELVRSLNGRAWDSAATFATETDTPVKRILLVDDTPTTRVLQKSILETAGYEVSMAVDGLEGWSLLDCEPFDLVISDVDMPRKDGFSLTEDIRRSDKHKHLPVILVTARGTDADKQRGADAGASAYIVKSDFDHSSLLATIDRLL